MVLIKILKRKDASSLIVALVIAGIISGMLSMILIQPATDIVGGSPDVYGPGGVGWKTQYAQPVIFASLQLIALELLAWIVIGIKSVFKKK